MLRLKEKHIEKGLDHKKLLLTTVKYHSGHIKHRYEIVDKSRKTTQYNFYAQRISSQSYHGL